MPFEYDKRDFGVVVALGLSIVASSCTYSDGAGAGEAQQNEGSVNLSVLNADRAVNLLAAGNRQLHEAWYDSALVSYRDAAGLYEGLEEWRGYVIAQTSEATALEKLSRFSEGLTISLDAANSARTLIGDSLLEARAMDIQAENLIRLGRYEDAMRVIESSLEMKYSLVDSSSWDIGRSLLVKGWVFQVKENFQSALANYTMSLKAHEQSPEPSLTEISRVHNNLGVVFLRTSRLDQAIQHLDASYFGRIESYGADHPLVAYALGNLSHTYSLLGDHFAALEKYLQALSVFKNHFGGVHHDVAISYQNISRIYLNLRNFELAEIYAREAVAIDSVTYGRDHRRFLSSKMSLGRVYSEAGKHEAALLALDDALETWHGKFGRYASSIEVLCQSKTSLNLKDGLECFDRAISHYHSDPYRNEVNMSSIYAKRGQAMRQAGQMQSALYDLETAAQYAETELGANSLTVLRLRMEIAEILEQQSRFEAALEVLDGIVSIEPRSITAHQSSRPTPLRSLVILRAESIAMRARIARFLRQSSDSKVMAEYKDAIALSLEGVRNNHRAIDEASDLMSKIVKDLMQTGLQWSTALDHGATIRSYFEIVESSRSLSLRTKIQNTNAKIFAGIPVELLDLERSLGATIESSRIALEKIRANSKDSTANAFRRELISATQSYDSLITVFEKHYPDYFRLKHSSKTATIQDVQAHLSSKEALIEYLVGVDSTYAFTITNDAVHFSTLGPSTDIKKVVSDYRTGLSDRDDSLYFHGAKDSYRYLVKPLLPVIGNRNLIVVPDDELYFIPFGPMLDEHAGEYPERLKYSKLHFLIDDRAVSYAYSATLLLETRKKPSSEPTKGLIAFAPVIEEGLVPGKAINASGFPIKSSAAFAPEHHKPLMSLPASRQEVKRIRKAIAKSLLERYIPIRSKIYLESNATESVLKHENVSDYRYVHLATHGFLREEEPNLSSLIFRTNARSNEDGILFLGEVYNLKLNADLVVLSACETGLGRIAENEGVIGMTRGFLYAGARNVVVSLWLANDVGARDTMVFFYESVRDGENFSESMRSAKVRFKNLSPFHSNPYYWAPFIVIGQ